MSKLLDQYRCIFEPKEKRGIDLREVDLSEIYDSLPDCEKYIADWASTDGSVTNWFWNDNYMEWCSLYYKKWCGSHKDNYKKLQRAFTYRCNKLVDKGFLKPCVKVGLGEGSENSFGVKTQTIWEYKFN